MILNVEPLDADERPSAGGSLVVEKMSRWLLFVLCASPVALFPVALAVRAFHHYFP